MSGPTFSWIPALQNKPPRGVALRLPSKMPTSEWALVNWFWLISKNLCCLVKVLQCWVHRHEVWVDFCNTLGRYSLTRVQGNPKSLGISPEFGEFLQRSTISIRWAWELNELIHGSTRNVLKAFKVEPCNYPRLFLDSNKTDENGRHFGSKPTFGLRLSWYPQVLTNNKGNSWL